MLNGRLAGDHLYGKQLFTWLSRVMSLLMSLCAVLFSTMDEIWDLIGSVSEGFPTYFLSLVSSKKLDTIKILCNI